MLSCQFHGRETTAGRPWIPKRTEVPARNAEESGLPPARSRAQPCGVVGHTVLFIAQPEVQSQPRGDLPIVLQEKCPIILMKIANPENRIAEIQKSGVFGGVDEELMVNLRNGPGQVRKRVFSGADIVRIESAKIRGIDARNRGVTHAQRGKWKGRTDS